MKYFILIITLFVSHMITAQLPADCTGDRYKNQLYPIDSLVQETYLYGRNVTPAGDSIDLQMTLFHNPRDNEFNKPVVIIAYGGGFVTGNKESVYNFAIGLAVQGVVAVAIDYRLWDIIRLGYPSELDLMNTAVMAVGDMKASIKMIRYLAENNPNLFIDPDRIIVGGVSAGAITSLHVGYVDNSDLNGGIFEDLIVSNGGLEGNSFLEHTENYSSEVSGVINYSGGLFDTLILDAGEPPLVSIHGDADDVVPYGYGKAVDLVSLYGSSLVHERALNSGVSSRFVSVPGGGHSDIYSEPAFANERAVLYEYQIDLFYEAFCDVINSIDDLAKNDLKLYPNPVGTQLTVESSDEVRSYQLFDMNGRMINYHQLEGLSSFSIPTHNLQKGIYFLKLGLEGNRMTYKKFVKQ